MITFQQLLSEGRDAPLYHGTSIEYLRKILEQDTIKLSPRSILSPSRTGAASTRNATPPFISLTRDVKHAAYVAWLLHPLSDAVLLKIDQSKLSRDYKIVPYHHTKNGGSSEQPMFNKRDLLDVSGGNEFEERVFKPITPLSKYLLSIIVKQNVRNLPDIIANHPKLVITQRGMTHVNKDNYRVSR